ncbi:hypothetical protein RHSP_31886 [Rhizobium freirei PRF 81]|uniref:Uncharacterized protein n=1 Tax=Rhizobium freirei PRF 81 TaxID=363754 RepID=N6UWL5_9HYPH|nr:hypothetical protein [Rhizobium freirei]ENN86055.1 hypothetical protein RHSP_31886 [Rhizobium freirei PRF 81]
MTDKKKAKATEVEGLVVKIGVDIETAAIAEATATLKELAEAANLAREALDRLHGAGEIVNLQANPLAPYPGSDREAESPTSSDTPSPPHAML